MAMNLRRSRGEKTEFTVPCGQCGWTYPDILRLTRRTVRTSCRICGAVMRRYRHGASPVEAPQSLTDTAADPLAVFMPPRMVRWVRSALDPGIVTDTPDKAALVKWYNDFDNFVAAARSSQSVRSSFEELSDVPLESLPAKPPRFNKIISALHATSYDGDAALRRVLGDSASDDFISLAEERVRHARNWFATLGRPALWFSSDDPVDVAPEAVHELLRPEVSAASLGREETRIFFAALFGVPKGPDVRGILGRFGEDRVRQALATYLQDGSRPLRDQLLAGIGKGAE